MVHPKVVEQAKVDRKSDPSKVNILATTWKPKTLYHINVESEEPLTFHTKQSLKDYCKKHKLRSGALE